MLIKQHTNTVYKQFSIRTQPIIILSHPVAWSGAESLSTYLKRSPSPTSSTCFTSAESIIVGFADRFWHEAARL